MGGEKYVMYGFPVLCMTARFHGTTGGKQGVRRDCCVLHIRVILHSEIHYS